MQPLETRLLIAEADFCIVLQVYVVFNVTVFLLWIYKMKCSPLSRYFCYLSFVYWVFG